MKRTLVMQCAVLVVTSVAWSAPSGIELLSQQHHVWGRAGTDSTQPGELPGGVYESYDIAASQPIAGSATGIEVFEPGYSYPVFASSSAGSFQVEAHGFRWTAQGEAESMYVFQPEEGTRLLTLDAAGWRGGHPFEVDMDLALTDLTTGMLVEAFDWSDGPDWPDPWDEDYWGGSFAWSRTCLVDPSHTYSLYLYAGAFGGDVGESDCRLAVGLSGAVPAPGAILLGVLGTGLVGWLRRRRVV